MWQLLKSFIARFECLVLRRHSGLADKAIFGRIRSDGHAEGLHICPHCGSYTWQADRGMERHPNSN